MSLPTYDFTHKVDSVDTIYAADINELQDAIEEIAERDLDDLLPDQTSNNGKVLKTNGTTASWQDDATGGGGGGGGFHVCVPIPELAPEDPWECVAMIAPANGDVTGAVCSAMSTFAPTEGKLRFFGMSGLTGFDGTSLNISDPVAVEYRVPFPFYDPISVVSGEAVAVVVEVDDPGSEIAIPPGMSFVLTFTPD